MTRKLKALGLALVSLLAISGVASSAALAVPGELHSETLGSSAILTGVNVGIHQATVKGTTLNCEYANFEGTVAKTTTDITVTPEYDICEYKNSLKAEVKMNGCKYTLTGAADFTANLDIVGCTSGKSIEIIDPVCVITIPEQKGLSHVVFANKAGPPKHIQASLTVSGITYIGDPRPTCGSSGGHHADGTLSGTTTIKAYEDEGLLEPIQIDGHQFQQFKDGIQIGLFST